MQERAPPEDVPQHASFEHAALEAAAARDVAVVGSGVSREYDDTGEVQIKGIACGRLLDYLVRVPATFSMSELRRG